MDIKRAPKSKLNKRIRTVLLIAIGVVAIGGITYGLNKMKPAAPTLDRSAAIIGTVKRGEMVREVKGNGTLVPQVTRWVPAPAEGRVEKIPVQAGIEVSAGTIIVELSNPTMEQQALDAEFQVKTAEADAENLKRRLESERMTQQSVIASIDEDYTQAKLQLDSEEMLAKQGLAPELPLKISRVHVQGLTNRLKLEQERLAVSAKSSTAQLNAQQSRVEQLRALAKLKKDQVDALKVRAGTNGVLQVISVQEGQQVTPGLNIARIADPASLKAELKVAETQINDVKENQSALVDTRNGLIHGRVSRIDPAAREGTFTVDVTFTEPLPSSARPDLSVDGTIELERLRNVLYVDRPAFGQAQQTVAMFKLTPDGQEAARTPVKLGRTSVSTVEILDGLREGDQVVISDTSSVDNYNRIRLR